MLIEVRILNPATREPLADEFTAPSGKKYDAFDHTAQHRESIELTVNAWSGGVWVVKSIQRMSGPDRTGSGSNVAWQYVYEVNLQGPPPDGESDVQVLAVLFAEHCEKKKEQGSAPSNFQLGQRVEVIDGSLKGEKATITANPENGCWYDKKDVWLTFDRDGETLHHWVMSQQWFRTDNLF